MRKHSTPLSPGVANSQEQRINIPMQGLMTRLGRWRSSENSHIVDLVRGTSVAGILKALAAVLSFGQNILLARVLGASASGTYFLAITTGTIAATIGRVGLDSAVLRFVATHASHNNWHDVRRVNSASLSIGFICCCVVAVVVYTLAGPLATRAFSDPLLATPLRIVAAAVVPLSLGVLVSQALLGLSHVRDALLVFSILPTGVALAAIWPLAERWGVDGAVAAYFIAVTIALIYGILAWRRISAQYPTTATDRDARSPSADLLRSGVPLLIGALLQLVMQMSGTLMLGVWADNTEVSLFSVAYRTALLITFVLTAVNTTAQAKFAALFAKRELDALAIMANKATLLMTISAAPVLAVFLIVPNFVMRVFGGDFIAGASTLQILSVGQFVNVAAGSVGVLLVMSGHEREYRNVQIVAACVVLVLNAILIPMYAAVGAAIACAAALVVQNVLFGYFVWTKLGILTFLPRRRPVHGT